VTRDDRRRAKIAETIEHIAARWAHADARLLRQAFPLLAEGRPVRVERIAERAGARTAAVERALAAGRAGRDVAGRVVELSGLTLHRTPQRLIVGDVSLFSCCGLLAHLTPLLLERLVTLEAIDPLTRRAIRLDLTPTQVAGVAPPEAVASFVVTEPGRMMTHVGAEFCGHVHHFVDSAAANTYASADSRRYVISISELRAAAEDLYARAWDDGHGADRSLQSGSHQPSGNPGRLVMASSSRAIIVLLACGLVLPAPVVARSPADSTAILAASLDYIEGWYTADVERMERALHPHLAKRFVETFTNEGTRLTDTSALELVQQVRNGGGSDTPATDRRADVRILDVFQDVASVRVDAHGWIDYMHLARFGDDWRIVNVLWEIRHSSQ
jgi:hypothetical protein